MPASRSVASLFTVLLTAAVAMLPVPARANDALMDLLDVLRAKGTLTDAEYNALRDAAQEQTQPTRPRPDDSAPEVAQSWTDTITVAGDMRLRYQSTDQDGTTERNRGRLRYRLGVIAEPAPRLEIGAGLASGSSDARSTNQTFDDAFSSKAINLDYAYAQYRVSDDLRVVAGKFRFGKYLYRSTDLLWDSDINPEGFSASLTRPNGLGTAFANTGIWVLEENAASRNDPYLLYGQIGQRFATGDVFATVAGSYYRFEDINALADYASTGSNTDYRFEGVYGIDGEVGVADLLGKGVRASLVGQWVVNPDTVTSRDSGYAIGVKASRAPWSFKYLYADLEANAWPDILPDSDRFSGFTGIDGHEFAVDYALWENVTLGLDYYNVDNQSGTNQDLLQLDFGVRF